MSKIEFGTYTPAQIAEHLKKLRPDALAEVLKCLAKDDQKAGARRSPAAELLETLNKRELVLIQAVLQNIMRSPVQRWYEQLHDLNDSAEVMLRKDEPSRSLEEVLSANKAVSPTGEKPTLVKGEPFENAQGELCGLCDGTHAHEHPQLKCRLCGEQGLVENMVTHVCDPKKTPKLSQRVSGAFAGLNQQVEQLSINQKWLIERIDGIHEKLCPGRIATWQERAIQAETAASKLVEAVQPFIYFITQFERQPLAKSHDAFYGIHGGTEFEANLKLSDMAKLRDLFKKA